MIKQQPRSACPDNFGRLNSTNCKKKYKPFSRRDIQKIQSVFSDFREVAMVKIYGSRAVGNFKPASDIDLCLFGEKLNLTTQQEIEFALDDLMLPYKFDVSTYHDISNPTNLKFTI
ncbi:nucleotidyltransferase domain-containing protein [Belliella sp. DSM 107340]|uniref:Nucleotidyltransferase domain-containing protein n=2 Tax=Belliella calami TaxID=2923436 RepID=A0ABS9ULG9_9BACT|nr:nucleotidyltransferase domain-containing protein [Belliella calami]